MFPKNKEQKQDLSILEFVNIKYKNRIMGMSYENELLQRKRRELRDRLIKAQEKESQKDYEINEYGEIVRGDSGVSQEQNSEGRISLQMLDGIGHAVEKRRAEDRKVWGMVKTLLYAYIGSILSILIAPSWFSPIYNSANWVFYVALILSILHTVGTYGKWLEFKEGRENRFFETSIAKFKIHVTLWLFLFLVMLIGSGDCLSINYNFGIFLYILCITFTYVKSYLLSKYIKSNIL